VTTPTDDPSPEPTRGHRPADLPGLELELPERGTGARAARRAAAAAAEKSEAKQPGAPEPRPRAPTPSAPRPPEATLSPGRVARRGPSRRWLAGFAAVLAVSVVVAGILAFVGVHTLRESNAGRRVTSVDPADPGFEGLLDPTPTLLVLHDVDGELRSVTLLSLANGDAGGSVVLMPPSLHLGTGEASAPLNVGYAFGATPDQVRGSAETVLGIGVQDVVVLDDARWRDLVAPVAPLHLDSPVAVAGFPAGPIDLAAADVGPWLAATGEGEDEVDRLGRQSLFWEAWTAAIAAASDPAAVPGELDSGIGRFVRGLAAGPLQQVALPVTEGVDAQGGPVLEVDRDAVSAMITEVVPFPTGTALAPRTLVRLLDGTGAAEHVRSVAPTVVAASASIVVVGNADAFDYQTTEIRYHQPGQRAAAELLQQALGAGTVVEDVRPIDAFDVTIVLGTDT
jgi:hypothetical protein